MNDQHFAAYGMQPQDKIETLAPALNYAWPVDEAPFSELLLLVIDETDQDTARPAANDMGINSVMQAG